MDDNFKHLASTRTDDELNERVNSREKYLPETVEASVEELQHRGHSFTEEELEVISEDIQARREQANAWTGFDNLFNNTEKIKQVADPDAPAFYTKRAIYIFSIVFSVLFGSILLAINVSKTPKRVNAIFVVLYGLAFTIAEVMLAERIHLNTGFAIIGGIIGSYPLNYFFWRSYLGNSSLYRAKSIWIPLIVGIVISAFFVILALQNFN